MECRYKKLILVFAYRYVYSYDDRMFGISFFKSKGLEVEVWSLVKWTFGEDIPVPMRAIEGEDIYYIKGKHDLIDNLERIKEEQCVFLLYPYHGYNFVWYTVRKYIRKYCFDFANLTETASVHIEIREVYRLSYFVRRGIKELCVFFYHFARCLTDNNMYSKLRNDVVSWIGPLRYRSKYNFIRSTFLLYSLGNLFEIYSRRNVFIPGQQYDECLEAESVDNQFSGKYIVYVDDYFVGHINYIFAGREIPIKDKTNYYAMLNRLFDAVENFYDMPVVVAAHPKAEYNGDEFYSRKIVWDKTNILIRDAELVLTYASTVLGNIIFMEKPFIFLYNPVISSKDDEEKRGEDRVKQIFKIEFLNELEVNEKTDFSKYVCSIDNNREGYDLYKERYVISEKSEKKRPFEIIFEKLICGE